MFSSFKDRDTPLSTAFSQLLIQVQVKNCKLIMLRCITIVRVVFLSSPCSISVVFPMFSMCLRSFMSPYKFTSKTHSLSTEDLGKFFIHSLIFNTAGTFYLKQKSTCTMEHNH